MIVSSPSNGRGTFRQRASGYQASPVAVTLANVPPGPYLVPLQGNAQPDGQETDTFNVRSQAFYAARGYQEARRYPDTEWDSGLTTILLVKSLG